MHVTISFTLLLNSSRWFVGSLASALLVGYYCVLSVLGKAIVLSCETLIKTFLPFPNLLD